MANIDNRLHTDKDVHDSWIEVVIGDNPFDRKFRSGILQYAKEHGFKRVQATTSELFSELHGRGAFPKDRLAVICHEHNLLVLNSLLDDDIPCVLAGLTDHKTLKRIRGERNIICATDNEGIGTMAAEYFLGQERFATYAFADGAQISSWLWWSRRRQEAYKKTLGEHGVKRVVSFRPIRPDISPDDGINLFKAQLDKLPKPVAIFACNDEVAREVVMLCDILNVRMPDDVSVLGVDNNASLCETAAVGISSIELETERLGRQAMELLEQMLKGEVVKGRVVFCPPSHVVERQSTSRTPLYDIFVAKAVDFISANADKDISVQDVVAACGSSRRFIEKRFKALTGRTILNSIHEKRLALVLNLLRNTDEPIFSVAYKAGFPSVPNLCVIFKRRFGISMLEYRQRERRIVKHD